MKQEKAFAPESGRSGVAFMKGVTVTGAAILGMSAPAPALSQQTPAPPAVKPADVLSTAEKFREPHGSHLEPILRKINASPEQRVRITTIVTSFKPKIEPLRQEYRLKSQEFINCLVTGEPAEAVMARMGELNQLYGSIVTQYSLMRLEIRKVLTPDQRKAYEEYRHQQGWDRQ